MLTSKEFARNYAHFLTKVVYAANNPNIRNYKTLLKEMVETNSNISILEEILSWLPFSKREDGMIYKSAPELAERCCISERTVYRSAKVLDKIGFNRKIMKANGDPTTHYALDMQAFLQAVGDVFATDWTTILQWMEAPTQKGRRQKRDGESNTTSDREDTASKKVHVDPDIESSPYAIPRQPDTHQNVRGQAANDAFSLTPPTSELKNRRKESEYQTTTMPTHHPVPLSLEKERMKHALQTSPRNIEKWIQQYGLDRVREVVAAVEQTPNIRNRGGWARQALEKGFQFNTNPSEARIHNVTSLMQALSDGMRRV